MIEKRTTLETDSSASSLRNRSENGALIERLDDALGEASSGIGVLLSELVRRTLRGGVQKIDEEMREFADEKVDDAVASRMPEFEEAATRTAVERAQRVAAEAVAAVDQEAKRTAEGLAKQISTVEQQTSETTERLLADLKSKSKATLAKVEANLRQLHQNSKELAGEFSTTSSQHTELIDQLQTRLVALEAELAELKKPRGFKAGLARLLGRNKT